LMMPGMSGREVARRVKTINPNIPVLLVSGYLDTISEEVARKQGFTGLIAKPFQVEELAEVVNQTLVKSREGR
jgi:CheY-like chemotaxis protein